MIEKGKEINTKKTLSMRTFFVPSIGAALFYLISFIVVRGAVYLVGAENASGYYGVITLISSIIMCASFFGMIIYFEKKDKINIYRLKPTIGGSVSAVVIGMGLLGFSFFYMSFVIYLSFFIPAIDRIISEYSEMMSYIDQLSTSQMILASVSSVIFVPIAEELLFRGIFLQEFLKVMKPSVAIMLSSALFAIMHFQPIQVGYAFICGLIIGVAYYYSKSIYVTIIIHIIFNFFGSTFYRVFTASNEVLSMKLAFEVIALFTMFIALMFIRKEGKDRVLSGAFL